MPSAMSQETESLYDWDSNSSSVYENASLHYYDPGEENSTEVHPSVSQNYSTEELSEDVQDYNTEELLSNVEDYSNNLQPSNIQDFDLEVECKGFTCIRKCCENGKYFQGLYCNFTEEESFLWRPTFYEMNNLQKKVPPPENLKYLYRMLPCEAMPLRPQNEPNDTFHLLSDGKLYVPIFRQYYSVKNYCIDKFSFDDGEPEEVALLCFGEPDCIVAKSYIIPLMLLVSCVFLGITLAVYVCIPELHGKLHGRCLMSMMSSLLVAYIMMTILFWAFDGIADEVCLICATVKHITLLASFFWLNVMCFDMWRSLKSFRRASETSARSMRRFAFYSLYAWGSPLIIGLVAVIIDDLPEAYKGIIRPDFLKPPNKCWFNGSITLWLYFYMIVLILVIANIFFFLSVAYIIYRSQTDQTLQSARSRNRDRVWLYGKLFLVMGITWITEVISWQQGTCQAWIFTDVINALQGFTIFLVFVCKKKTRQMVARKLSVICRNFSSSRGTTRSTTGHNANSISHNTNSTGVSRTPESRRLVMFDQSAPSPRSTRNRMEAANIAEERQCDTAFSNDKNSPANVAGSCQLNGEECHTLDGKKEAQVHENIPGEVSRSTKDDNTQMPPNSLIGDTENLETATIGCDHSVAIPDCSKDEDMSGDHQLNVNEFDRPVNRQKVEETLTETAESTSCSGESLPLIASGNQKNAFSAEEANISHENLPMIIEDCGDNVSQEKPER